MSLFVPFHPGTITLTNGDDAIVGTGTSFTQYRAGDTLSVPGIGAVQLALDPTDDEAATASTAWAGTTQTGVAYDWTPIGSAAALGERVRTLIESITGGNLAAFGALTGAADELPYFDGAGSFDLATFTALARTLLAGSTAGDMLDALGVSAFVQTVLDDADAAAVRATLSALGGSTGSVDNRLLRSDGTGGATAQDSAMTVDDSGNVTSFGGQIKFPATQNPSSDPNTLDDYEEGTSTPTVSAGSGTITSASASLVYTKVGRVVFYIVSITVTTNGTGASQLRFTLPFTPAASSQGFARETSVDGKGSSITITSGSTTAIMTRSSDNSYPAGNGTGFIGSGHFIV